MSTLVESTSLFKAFADPTRLRILNLIAVRELCVCHLVDLLGEPQPKISRHLAMLRKAGLVTRRIDGPWRHYALAVERRGLNAYMLDAVATCLADVDELREDRRRLATMPADLSCN